MPRETIDIQTFNRGIFSAFDSTDIPKESAKADQNLDFDLYPGELCQRRQDAAWSTDNIGYYLRTGAQFITRPNSTRNLVYFQDDGSSSEINVITGWPTHPATETQAVAVANATKVAMQPHNDCVYAGWQTSSGVSSSTPSKWVGYIPYGQFGDPAAPNDLVGVNAACDPPGYFPQCYKTVADDDGYIYGIEWKGNYIYKINVSTGAVTRSTTRFTSLQGLCHNDDTYLIVLDYVERPGTLIRVAKSDLNTADQTMLVYSSAKDPWLLTEGGSYSLEAEPSDLEVTRSSNGDFLWISWYNDGYHLLNHTDTNKRFGLYKLDASTMWSSATNSSYIAIRLPEQDSSTRTDQTDDGNFYLGDITTNYVTPKKTPFVKRTKSADPDYADIGYLCKFGKVYGVKNSGGYETDPPTAVMGDSILWIRDDATDLSTYTLGGKTNDGTYGGKCATMWLGNNAYDFSCIKPLQEDSVQGANDENTYRMIGFDKNGSTHPGWSVSTVENAWYNYVNGLSADIYEWGNGTFASAVYPTPDTTYDKSYFDQMSDVGACMTQGSAGSPYTTHIAVIDRASETWNWRPRYVLVNFSNASYSSTNYKASTSLLMSMKQTVDGGTFDGNKRYWYRVSLSYDGMQESPLNLDYIIPYITSPTATRAIQVTVTLYSPDTWLNKRVNAVNVYRAEGLTTDDRPSSFYRLVGTIDLTSPWANATQTGWTATAYSANLLDTGTYGPAYEANSGLPETLQDSNVNYAVSASYGGYHFVGNCYHSYWEDASRTIFRSQPNAFSSFNALSSYVVLPIIPTALAAWNGYLYAFDETSIYRINVNTLGVEDKLNGYGALNQDGVLVRPEGIYFADAQNIYLYNGNIQRIGDPIATSGSSFQAGHQAYITAGYNVSLLSYERKSSLACLYTRSGGTPDILLFHFKTNSWHYWHIENSNTNDAGQYSGTTSGAKGGFTDKAGDLFIGMGIDGTYDGILKVSGRTNAYHAGYWYTPDFPLDDHSQNKKFYGCTVLGTVGSTTLTYDVNLTGSYGASPGLKTFFKSMSVLIFLNSTTTLQRVKTFSLMFRRMIGKR